MKGRRAVTDNAILPAASLTVHADALVRYPYDISLSPWLLV
jgi:hypothetical protein